MGDWSVITADQSTAAPAAAGVRLTSYSTRARSRLRKAADLLHGIKIAARALADTEAFEQSRRDRKRVPVTVGGCVRVAKRVAQYAPIRGQFDTPSNGEWNSPELGRPTSRAAPRPSCPVHLDHWWRSNGTMLVVADST